MNENQNAGPGWEPEKNQPVNSPAEEQEADFTESPAGGSEEEKDRTETGDRVEPEEAIEDGEISSVPEEILAGTKPEEYGEGDVEDSQAGPLEPLPPESQEPVMPPLPETPAGPENGMGGMPVQPPAGPWAWAGQQPYPAPGPYPQGWQAPAPYGPGVPYGYPPYGPAPGTAQPVQPQAQAAPTQPQPPAGYGYYYPVYYAYAQAGQAGQPVQPPAKRKKLALGAKVFLWIAGVLTAAGLIGGIAFFTVKALGERPSEPDYGFGYDSPFQDPEEKEPENQEPEEDEDPDESEEVPRPQVDVTPNTEGIQIQEKPLTEVLDAEAVYNQVVPSTVTVAAELTRDGQTGESTGTGIIATSDGYIITNSHVVLNSKSALVTVTTYDGQEYDAVVVGVDRTTDLAVLKTNDHNFVPAEFGDAGELSVGEWVMAIGNPGGARFSSSLTRGIISGLNREVGKYSENGMTYIQTDAAINPGNSGGPLVNMYGQVVGINSSKIITEGYEGMGFAIPVSKAQPIINELLSGGYIKGRTRLGIMCRELNASTASMYGAPRGLQITEFNEDSSFAGTEAQEGDVLIAIEGEPVESLRDVSNLLLRYEPGDKVKVTLYRPSGSPLIEGRELEVEITLLEDKGETQD